MVQFASTSADGSSEPFLLQVSRGHIPGHSPVNKFGASPEVALNTKEDVWDGAGQYTFLTTAAITHIRAGLDSATTQGARIEVRGLDANWELVVQTKDLDGANSTTEVALDTPLIRVFRMKVLENAVMDQDIWAGDDDFIVGAASAIIQAGNNQTLMAIYTVPAGKTAYMTSYYGNVTDTTNKTPTSTEIGLWAADRARGYEFQLKHQMGIAEAAGGFQHNFSPYYKFSEKTDIKITALPADEPAHIHAGFDLIVIEN